MYDSFAPFLYGKIIAVVEDPVWACHILEKTFVYAITNIHQHNIHLPLHSWLWQIAGFKILEDAANTCVGDHLPEDKELEHYLRAWLPGIYTSLREPSGWYYESSFHFPRPFV